MAKILLVVILVTVVTFARRLLQAVVTVAVTESVARGRQH